MASTPEGVATSADIESAYRLLLGRSPDLEGFENHLRWIAAEKPTPFQVAERFLASAEYRSKVVVNAERVAVDMAGYIVFARRGDVLIGAPLIRGHPYEPNVINAFRAVLHEGSFVLDIGANIGVFTFLAASIVGERGKVIAVEPLPQNHRSLYAGVLRNQLSNVQVMPFAASDKAGLISIRCAPDSSNGIVGADDGNDDSAAHVPTHRLADVLANLPRLDVVKIDIEGHEPAAWRGMQALVAKHRPVVFSEFSPIAMRNVGHDALEYLAMLFAYSSQIRVLHRDEDPVECHNAESVMQQWREANLRARMNGELHLDLHLIP